MTAVKTNPHAAVISFTSTARRVGRWLIVELPESASARLPSRGQVSVEGVINGHSFAFVLEPDGRRGHWLKLETRLQRAMGIADGASVELEIAPTKMWPEPTIPKDFRAALTDATDLSELWKDLTPMARWEWVRWINATRNPDTRKRRIEVSVSKLRAGTRRPCCFDLAACTDPDLARNGKLVEAA